MENVEGKLYSIGEVSKTVKIPASALRFYDEQGILVPQVRDNESNYRYYTENQVMEALFIVEMKRIGVPLNRIRDIIAQKQLLLQKANLEEQIVRLQDEIEHLRFRNNYAEQLLNQVKAGIEILSQSRLTEEFCQQQGFSVRYLPAKTALRLHMIGCFYEQAKFTHVDIQLHNICEQKKLQICGCPTSIFCDEGTEHFNKDIYESDWILPVRQDKSSDENICHYDAFWGAVCTHIGTYDSIPLAYESLLAWTAEKGLEVDGPPMEEYLINCCHGVDSGKYITNVIFPIKPPPHKN